MSDLVHGTYSPSGPESGTVFNYCLHSYKSISFGSLQNSFLDLLSERHLNLQIFRQV